VSEQEHEVTRQMVDEQDGDEVRTDEEGTRDTDERAAADEPYPDPGD